MSANTRHRLFGYLPGIIVILITLSSIPKAEAQEISVGDDYGGGIVAYIFKPGDLGYIEGETHGLIISKEDIGIKVKWSTGKKIVTGADRVNLGAGIYNTEMIVSELGEGNYAAKLCYDYVVKSDSTIYDDWYLPSKAELHKAFENRSFIRGFKRFNHSGKNSKYWTSTEHDKGKAWHTNMSTSFSGGIMLPSSYSQKNYNLGGRTYSSIKMGPMSSYNQSSSMIFEWWKEKKTDKRNVRAMRTF
ncbi:MAG: hypothetical protein C1941_00125 [Prosthecochloris sp.]|nr:hypothetical protein [Prosthecochloris sp.]